MVAAPPDRDVPMSCPVIDSATERRCSSDNDLPMMGYMAPVDRASKTCSGVISRNASGEGACLKAGLPWQLRQRCWKRPNPCSTEGAAVTDFSRSVEAFAADSAVYACPVD